MLKNVKMAKIIIPPQETLLLYRALQKSIPVGRQFPAAGHAKHKEATNNKQDNNWHNPRESG
jgi:hypothetical protein